MPSSAGHSCRRCRQHGLFGSFRAQKPRGQNSLHFWAWESNLRNMAVLWADFRGKGKYWRRKGGRPTEQQSKQKFALRITGDTLQKVEKLYREDDCTSRSEFIEKAILFYVGYLTASDGNDYLPNVIISTVKGSLDSLESRLARLLFKIAVELSMMLHVTAATNEIDESTLSKLRGMCVNEVSRLQRTVTMDEAAAYQHGG